MLGMLAKGARTGYDIKRIVDHSTRFFWAASYGQIYPELKRLAEAGLVEASSASGGRQRRAYELTDSGRTALREWLTSPDQTHELRDEGLLKLFFASELTPPEAREVLEVKRRGHEETVARLREIEPLAASAASPYPLMVLTFGIALHEFSARWCAGSVAQLDADNAKATP